MSKNKSDILVSIIMPSYNSSRTISESIQSVLSQTFNDFELIICDDKSEDDSVSVISRYKDDRILVLNNESNLGAARTRNKCLEHASGRFIAFLDSDDFWSEEKLENQIGFMLKENVSFSYGDYQVIDKDGKRLGVFIAPNTITFNDLCKTCNIGCLTVVIDRFTLNRDFSIVDSPKEDYATWLVVLKENKLRARKSPGLHSYYRVGSKSLSSNKLSEIKKQYYVLTNVANLSHLVSFKFIISYIANGLFKHLFRYKGV